MCLCWAPKKGHSSNWYDKNVVTSCRNYMASGCNSGWRYGTAAAAEPSTCALTTPLRASDLPLTGHAVLDGGDSGPSMSQQLSAIEVSIDESTLVRAKQFPNFPKENRIKSCSEQSRSAWCSGWMEGGQASPHTSLASKSRVGRPVHPTVARQTRPEKKRMRRD